MQAGPIGFLKRRWVFLSIALLILLGTALYAWQHPNRYRSEARIIVTPDASYDRELSAAEAKESIEAQILKLQQTIESRVFLESIAEQNLPASQSSEAGMAEPLDTIRQNLEVSRSSQDTLRIAYCDIDPEFAHALTTKLAATIIEVNRASLRMKAMDRQEFLDQELARGKHELAALEASITKIQTAHSGERVNAPQGTLLREQAVLARHLDEVGSMKLDAEMTVNFLQLEGSERVMIADEATLPKDPVFPARIHILLMGIGAALIAALPAAFKLEKPAGNH